MFDFGESFFALEFNFLPDSHVLAVDHWSPAVREPVAVPDNNHVFEDYSRTDTANLDSAVWQQLLTSTSSDTFLFEAQETDAGDDGGVIVVTGKRLPLPDWDGGGMGGGSTGGDGGGTGGGGGSGGGTSNTDFSVSNDDSSCENGAATKAADTIDSLSDSQGDYEYSGVLVRNSDGTYGLANNEVSTLYSTTYSTFDNLSDASSVYGVIHNHTFNSSDYN